MSKPKILLNRWKSKDGTILISRLQHDFVEHFDAVEQKRVFIDGGVGPYIRVSGNLENMCLYDTDDDHMEVRENYLWGTFGPNGDQPMKKVAIKDLTTDHIQNTLRTQIHLQEHVLNMFRRELTYRVLTS